ncbi:MAG: hypothetical protein IJ864_05675, partial [Alphaproteobacteria bacterium]|nr:hypothetical protein [Alphaproteobacteria bacterium]
KKKKKKVADDAINSFATTKSADDDENKIVAPIGEANVLNDFVTEEAETPVEAVIHNDAYKYHDDFSNINLNQAPLEADDDGEDLLSLEDLIRQDDKNETLAASQNNDFADEDFRFDDDDLNFSLPEQGVDVEEHDAADDANKTSFDTLDDLVTDDGLSFALPEQGSAVEGDGDTPLAPAQQNTMKENDDEFSLDELIEEPEQFKNYPDETEKNTDSDHGARTSDLSLSDFIDQDIDEYEEQEQDNVEDSSIANDDAIYSQPDEPLNDVRESSSQNRYSAEMDKIRQALTGNHIDLSSLDHPIALDDYDDDDRHMFDQEDSTQTTYAENYDDQTQTVQQNDAKDFDTTDDNSNSNSDNGEDGDDQDWEWEYVDENGNVASVPADQDWEWEYVDENGNPVEPQENENNSK